MEVTIYFHERFFTPIEVKFCFHERFLFMEVNILPRKQKQTNTHTTIEIVLPIGDRKYNPQCVGRIILLYHSVDGLFCGDLGENHETVDKTRGMKKYTKQNGTALFLEALLRPRQRLDCSVTAK